MLFETDAQVKFEGKIGRANTLFVKRKSSYGFFFFSYLTDFSYFSMEKKSESCRIVRTDQN